MITENKGLRVEQTRTKLIVDHNGEDLTFLHPAYGPNNYATTEKQIKEEGLVAPTIAKMASFLYGTHQNPEERFSKGIINLSKTNWLWAFTGSLYIPKEGVYIQDNPEVKEGMPFMDKSELVKKLEVNDPSVRFIPFGFKTGEMSPLDLSKNSYIISLAGEEGAEKLAEVADKYKSNPCLWSFESVEQSLTRVSALYSYWYGRRLDVGGDYLGDNRIGYAFGVQKTGEARQI